MPITWRHIRQWIRWAQRVLWPRSIARRSIVLTVVALALINVWHFLDVWKRSSPAPLRMSAPTLSSLKLAVRAVTGDEDAMVALIERERDSPEALLFCAVLERRASALPPECADLKGYSTDNFAAEIARKFSPVGLKEQWFRAADDGDMPRLTAIESVASESEAASWSIDQTDEDGWTALFFAVGARRYVAADWLIRHGASTNHVAANGDKPLSIAVRLGDARMAELLVMHGADYVSLPAQSGPPTAATKFIDELRLSDRRRIQLRLYDRGFYERTFDTSEAAYQQALRSYSALNPACPTTACIAKDARETAPPPYFSMAANSDRSRFYSDIGASRTDAQTKTLESCAKEGGTPCRLVAGMPLKSGACLGLFVPSKEDIAYYNRALSISFVGTDAEVRGKLSERCSQCEVLVRCT